MQAIAEKQTDYEMLREAFGSGYFIFNRIRNKMILDLCQQRKLHELIEDRNHFEILSLVRSLRG